jgi:hypothetical protein
VLVHACNPCTWEAEAGGWGVPGKPGQLGETLSQNKVKQNKTKQNKTKQK